MNTATSSLARALSAVEVLVRDALHAAAQALATAASERAAAQNHWQAAHTALQGTGHRGLVKFSAELGALITAADGDLKADRAQVFANGSAALNEYVAALRAGRRDQPLRLWPAYEKMQLARGVAQPRESDLFFPDLSACPGEPAPVVPLTADELRATRRALEGGLLQWLRKADSSGLQQISDAVTRIEAAQARTQERRLWWVARAVLDALLHQGLAADAHARRLLTQLNLHLGRLLQGPAESPEPLLRDALFLAARAQPVTPLIEDVQHQCGLRGALALEDQQPATPVGFTAAAVSEAFAKTQGLQDLWSACACGTANFAEFEHRARALAGACVPLGEPALTALAEQLADTAHNLARRGASDADAEPAALEGACALLLVEHVLTTGQPDVGLAQRARGMAARLQASVEAPHSLATLPPAQWLDEATQQTQAAQRDSQVLVEIEQDLGGIERALESWFGNLADRQALNALDQPLRRVAGAFSMLGHEEAAALAEQSSADVLRFAQGAECGAEEERVLSRRLSVMTTFVEALKSGPAQLAEVLAQLSLSSRMQRVQPEAAPAALADMPAVELAVQVQVPPAVPAPPAAVPVDAAGDTDREMLDIFLEEADEVLATIAETLRQSRATPQDQELLTAMRRAFHTLKGSGRMVGLKHFGEAAWELEQVFNDMLPQRQRGTPDLYRLVERAQSDFTRWIEALREHTWAAIDAETLTQWARRLRAGEGLPSEPAAALPVVEPPASAVPVAVDDNVMVGEIRVSRALYDIMLPEAQQTLAVLDAQERRARAGAAIDADFVRAAHTLSGISGTAGLAPIRALAASLEHVLEAASAAGTVLPADARGAVTQAVSALHEQVADVAALKAPAAHAALIAVLDEVVIKRQKALQPPAPAAAPAAAPLPASVPVVEVPPAAAPLAPQSIPAAPQRQALTAVESSPALVAQTPTPAPIAAPVTSGERRRYRVNDDIDAQLLPIFLEEAAELVPQVGQDLRAWRARPEDKLVAQSLKRLLHTLKGSARMAGAMALGQLTHGMESRIENAQRLPVIPETLIDELETSFDRIGVLINQLQVGEAAAPTVESAALPQAMEQMSRTMQMATVTGKMTQLIPLSYAAEADGVPGQIAGLPRPLIRVRADLIERLANQVGEVSIARSRVTAELRSARASLRELTENVSRLRAQLRELEIQAETQMQSRFSPAPDQVEGKFDPLEFDRFTRLQELTRLLAESVNDVATVQHSLARDLDEGDKALAAQAQTTRDAQQDLMAIRMVPFSSISDRLYRVTRLSAKDAEKRIGLDIVGEQVEMDRSVMDRIAAPIEHLLRNAIVHGIEAPQRRVEIGKPEAGALKLEVRQEGNEVVLVLSDDGDGLNIERIREKAISLGIMREDERISDQQIGNFIFRSGFSTANAVTAEAGRGVGMDVVMSEVTALGGRLSTAFERGKGTQFTIHLPLTLSVLQSVVMRLASSYFAVPTAMVAQVQRLKADVLAAAHDAGVIEWQGARYPFHHLATLLETEGGEAAPQYGSVLLLRSGSGRAAIQVDDIVGGQEIVIKNIGPQLARVPGITGAAVLGTGETVLILNPVLLTARHLELVRAREFEKKLEPAAVAGLRAAAAQPQRQRSVLVVDDSLTVRKITDRLLSREGYRVTVAKDGIEALEKLRDDMPDVMITDVEMPRMDGFDLAKNVRADDSLKRLPIIMITSRTADKHRQHASELGVNVFLGKPYEESELLGHIAKLSHAVSMAKAMR